VVGGCQARARRGQVVGRRVAVAAAQLGLGRRNWYRLGDTVSSSSPH